MRGSSLENRTSVGPGGFGKSSSSGFGGHVVGGSKTGASSAGF